MGRRSATGASTTNAAAFVARGRWRRWAQIIGLWSGVLVAVAACAGAGSPSPQVVVLVHGLPVDVPASISIVGGAGEVDLSSGGIVELAPGSYEVHVGPSYGPEPIARTVYDGSATRTSLELAVGDHEVVDVTYVRRPGTGRAWMIADGAVHAYDPAAWSTSGPRVPSVSLAAPDGYGGARAIAYGDDGDLFVTLFDGGIARYPAAILDQDGATATAVATVPEGSIWPIAIDSGRLYVFAPEIGIIYRFDEPGTIVGDGIVGPDATLAITGYDFFPTGGALAFDGDGRLWVASYYAIMRFDEPWDPSGATTVEPDAAVEHVAGARMGFHYHRGALFAGHFDSNAVFRYDGVDALQGAHPMVPSVIDVGMGHVATITTDASGRFWLAAHEPNGVARYPDLSEIAHGSVIAPIVTITHQSQPNFTFVTPAPRPAP